MNEKTPIYTKITNLTNNAFTFYYAPKGAVWIGAQSTVTVPCDLWSAADRLHREGLIASVIANQVSLVLGVIQTDGTFKEFEYQPNLALGLQIRAKEEPKTEAPVIEKTALKPAQYTEHDDLKQVGDGDKIILASDQGAKKLAEDYGVGTEEVGVPVQKEIVNGEAVDVVKPEETVDAPAEEEKPNPPAGSWDEYTKAIEEKRWAEAADMLNAMGAEPKVTARGLMSLKDRSAQAVQTKYNIAQG